MRCTLHLLSLCIIFALLICSLLVRDGFVWHGDEINNTVRIEIPHDARRLAFMEKKETWFGLSFFDLFPWDRKTREVGGSAFCHIFFFLL